MKRSILSIATLILYIGFFYGCDSFQASKRATKSETKQANKEYRTIIDWLECEECVDGELNAVIKLGERAVPSLVAYLNEGPSQANRELFRRHLITTYQKLNEYKKTHPEAKVAMSEKEYVKTYMDNYVALYQTRAAKALAAIGGPTAQEALKKALRAPMRDDVKIAVKDSLSKLSGR